MGATHERIGTVMIEAGKPAALPGPLRVNSWWQAHQWAAITVSLLVAVLISSSWLIFPYLVKGKKVRRQKKPSKR